MSLLLTAVKLALDTIIVTNGVGQSIRVAGTFGKLMKCGKGIKMATTFTANAQKINTINTMKTIATATAARTAIGVAEKEINKSKEENKINGFDDKCNEMIKTYVRESEVLNNIKNTNKPKQETNQNKKDMISIWEELKKEKDKTKDIKNTNAYKNANKPLRYNGGRR